MDNQCITTGKNRCINCAFLAYDFSDGFDQLGEAGKSTRKNISKGQPNARLRCYKGIMGRAELEKFSEDTICPKNEWKQYTKGISPARAYEYEKFDDAKKDSKRNIGFSKAILIGTIILIILTAILIYLEIK
jgi:hypothetical protein